MSQKAGVPNLVINLSYFILTKTKLITLTDRTNIDQDISNIESYQHFHVLKIKTEN